MGVNKNDDMELPVCKKNSSNLYSGVIAILMFSQPSQAINNDLTLYLWAAGISGNATLGSHDVPSLPVDVDFDDILEDIEFGFQVHYEGVGEK